MKKNFVLIFLVVACCLFFSLHFYAQDVTEKKDQPVVAESLEQLMKFLGFAAKSNDIRRLKQIINSNNQLIRENRLFNIQLCSFFLNRAIKKALSEQIEQGKDYLLISQTLGEMYNKSSNSQYLLDKVAIFRKWDKEQKVKYLEAEKLFAQGEKLSGEYKFEPTVELYNRSISLYREIGYKEGEANILQSLGEVHEMLSNYEQALSYYNECLAIYRKIEDPQGEASSLGNLGTIHGLLSEYKQARSYYEECLVIFRELKNRQGEATCLRSLGDSLMGLSLYDQAKVRYKESLVINREIKYPRGVANSLKSIGSVHRMLSEPEDAQRRYKKALAIYREIKDRLGEANSLKSLGDVQQMLYKYKQAQVFYGEALVIYRKLGDSLGEANSLRSLGDVLQNLDEYEHARSRYEECLAIYRVIKDRIGEANSLSSLGDVQWMLSNYEQARNFYEGCLALYREIKNRVGEANSLRCLGDVYQMLSEYEQARVCYKGCLSIYREIKDRLGEANSLRCLGDALWNLKKYDQARIHYQEGLIIFRKIGSQLGEANSLRSIGDVHQSLGDYAQAQIHYEEGLVIFRKINNRRGEAQSLQSLGDVHLASSDYEKARVSIEKALVIQIEIQDRQGMFGSYYRLGQTFEALKKPLQAEEHYIKSIEVIEDVWDDIKVEELKTAYFGSKIQPYEALINLLFNQGKGEAAYSYAERSKAKSFLYLLGNKRVNPKEGVPLELVEEEAELKQKITSKTLKIMENEENQQISWQRLRKELLQLKQKHFEIMEKIKRKSPEYASLVSVNPMTVEDIQALIHAEGNMILLEYYTTPEAIFLWILDGKQIHPYKIDITESELKSKIERYSSFVTKPSLGFNGLTNRAKDLYGFLLKPIEPLLKEKKYIGIIPHGALHYLPFETLITEKSLLLEKDVRIFYLPSASTYKYCKEKNQLSKTKIIALGNPDGTLPHTKKEIEYINDLFHPNSEIFIGEDAKESRIKDKKIASSSDIIHLACHGTFDSDRPMDSHLKLAPGDGEDGRLETQEIYNLHLKPAYLVTLSACQTHKGGLKPGDEFIGLNRAFIYAGTSGILASLWGVDDYYTEKFMVAFYRALKNSTKIEALHTARQTIIHQYGKKHPYYWAAFVLTGDPR